jgi:transposase
VRFAGIDVGSLTHSVAILDDGCGVLLKPTSFGEDAVGYQRLFGLLGTPAEILVVMEATGHYGRNLCGALIEREFRVALVNPLRTRRFAEEDLVRAKTDRVDALGIARFGAQKRPAATAWDTSLDDLRELVRYHQRLVQDLGDRVRQLYRLVHLGFPEFVRHVRTLDSQRATAILHAYPTARAFDESCLGALAALRCDDRPRVVGPSLAQTLVAAARVSVGRYHGPAYCDQVRRLCEDIAALRKRSDDLASEITRTVSGHPIGLLLTSIDGLGPITAARILGAVGDPARFRSAGALAAYVGVVPGTKESGLLRSRHAHLSPIGNARLRKALYMTTLSAVQRNPWLRAHYQRLRRNGKLPKVALVAAMRKLLAVVYSVAKNRRPFTFPDRPDGQNEV